MVAGRDRTLQDDGGLDLAGAAAEGGAREAGDHGSRVCHSQAEAAGGVRGVLPAVVGDRRLLTGGDLPNRERNPVAGVGGKDFPPPSCPRRDFLANWSVASSLDPPRSSRVRGYQRLLKLLAGIILAGCVGGLGLSPVAGAAAEGLSQASPLAPASTAPARLLQANVPAHPGGPVGSDGLVTDFDRESEPDIEAHLVLIGGSARDGHPFPVWGAPVRSLQQPGSAPPQVRLPRCCPIRC